MALVRVKRRLTDDPVDALLVTTKRSKKDGLQATTLFQFAATVKKYKEIAPVLKRVFNSSNVLKSNVSNVEKLTQKFKEEIRNNSAANRLKVVNCFRSMEFAADAERTDGPLTVLHIETRAQQISSVANATPEPSTSVDSAPESVSYRYFDDRNYVMDLYYTNSFDISDSTTDNILSAIPLGNDVLFQDHYYDSDEECYGDDEDSNDENDRRNDYPDEEDEERESSSDGVEEFCYYTRGSEEENVEGDTEFYEFRDQSSEDPFSYQSSDEEHSEYEPDFMEDHRSVTSDNSVSECDSSVSQPSSLRLRISQLEMSGQKKP